MSQNRTTEPELQYLFTNFNKKYFLYKRIFFYNGNNFYYKFITKKREPR